MSKQDVGLSVRELLKNTYILLCERHKPQQIVLADRALAEIANDSDWHRTRVGYMGYENVGLFGLNGKEWAIARGEACGSYPAEPYDSDILALEFDLKGLRKTKEQIQEELKEAIGMSSYFENSLVYGMADGNLAVSENSRFGKKMLETLRPEMQKFIAEKPEYDSRYLSLSTLSPVCTKNVKYKNEFADFLADSIENVLR